MIRHIVAWNYKDGFSAEKNREIGLRVKSELENLVSHIKEIMVIHVILDPAETSNREVVLVSLFRDEEDLANYQIHPEHVRVSKYIGSVLKDRVCLDLIED